VFATAACQPARETESLPVASRAADIALASDVTVVTARVTTGATLATILQAERLAASEIATAVRRASAVFDLRKVRAAQPYRLERGPSGTLRHFEYEIDGDRQLHIARGDGDDLVAHVVPIPKTRRIERVEARIGRATPSLVAALEAAGETIDLALAIASILGGEIDFSTEVQAGDRVAVSVEKQFRPSAGFAGYGPILAVEFVNAGRRVTAVRYAPEGGSAGYFDERGVSLRRFFLASPLKFQPVVTSGFSRGRLHPILREVRAHLGVDYKAPAGSPVLAVADGVVVSAGTAGASGRMVHLRHANGYETQYLHLSTIAVHAGARVRQGDLIGRVGSTGLATGPHLDYRVKRNGAYINPVAAHRSLPPADPIPKAEMAAFVRTRDRALEELTATPPVALASH